ncbi:MAG: COG4705 family protein [Trinickia sp.]|uniref:COG4705 family protein n=1 Tax=Trinickia sp. TaxID=2571163 RepID=UPI003F7FCD55
MTTRTAINVQHDSEIWLSKVPQATAVFWLVKILATTVGETGGDALSMTLKLGYAVATLIFLAFFIVTLTIQVRSRSYHPAAYWAVVIATTTVGTTTSDFLDRTAGLGYIWSSALLLLGVLIVLALWRTSAGRIEYDRIVKPRDEVFYWVTILVSNTLGTALGDFAADDLGLGFEHGALLFAGLLVIVALVWRLGRRVPIGVLFWAAYILTRPLGATLGDTLTKPLAQGGLDLNRISASLAILAAMVVIVVIQHFARGGGRRTAASSSR